MKLLQTLARFLRLIGGIAGLSAVIIVHEFGHFVACKLFGVPTPVFSIGFGPQIFAFKLGTTLFQIAALPLGGYVAIAQKELAAQPYAAKLIILLAGILFNFLFALLVFIYLALRGKYHITPVIEQIIPDSPAQRADLQKGDTCLAVDHLPIDDATAFVQAIMQSPGQTFTITIDRVGTTLEVPITIADNHPSFGKNVGWLGVSFKKIRIKPKSWLHALQEGTATLATLMRKLGTVSAAVFKKGKKRGGIVGPIGIIAMTTQSLQLGFDFFLLMLALLSINVGIFNLLPIPFFDGGQIVRYTIEALLGPIAPGIINIINILFLLLLIFLLVTITMRDIARIGRNR